jgi:hypothetical protein
MMRELAHIKNAFQLFCFPICHVTVTYQEQECSKHISEVYMTAQASQIEPRSVWEESDPSWVLWTHVETHAEFCKLHVACLCDRTLLS